MRDTERAARQAQQHDLRQVDRQHLSRAAADALEDGDAPDLLLNEHARHARDADAAQNEDDQSHEAEIVLGAREVLIHPSFVLPVRADADEIVDERFRQLAGEHEARISSPRQRRWTRHLQQQSGGTHGCQKTADPSTGRSARSMNTREPERKGTEIAPGLALNHAANLEASACRSADRRRRAG